MEIPAPISQQRLTRQRRAQANFTVAAVGSLLVILASIPASQAFAAVSHLRAPATLTRTGVMQETLAGGELGRSRVMASKAIVSRQAGEEAPSVGVRVGVLNVKGATGDFKAAFESLKVNTSAAYFQTEVPDVFQLPMAAKWLAMSQTVDVIVAAHGALSAEDKTELLRSYQNVALTTNVPMVPCTEGVDTLDKVAEVALAMGEIRQQALMQGGPRKSMFFGIGKNDTATPPGKKDKVYF